MTAYEFKDILDFIELDLNLVYKNEKGDSYIKLIKAHSFSEFSQYVTKLYFYVDVEAKGPNVDFKGRVVGNVI
jgi:hypothetical protein